MKILAYFLISYFLILFSFLSFWLKVRFTLLAANPLYPSSETDAGYLLNIEDDMYKGIG